MADLDLIRGSNGAGEAVQGTVTAKRNISSTTITVDSLLNFPSKAIITTGTLQPDGTLDPSSVTVMLAHLAADTLEIDQFAPGYIDNGNSVGDVVLVKPTTAWADNIADFLAEGHKADGSVAQVNPNDPGLLFSTSATQPTPDIDGRTIVWFQPLS